MLLNNSLPTDYSIEISKLASKQIEIAQLYADSRRKAGEAEADLKILLASRLKELRENKKNLGIEMAYLILCEDNELAKNLLKEMTIQESLYKGYEKILDANNSKLITEQALMKWQHTGEKYG